MPDEKVTLPVLVIQPRSAMLPLHLRELWEYREVAYRLAARDLTLRYRQTALGILWVVMQPLLAAAIFTVVFGLLARFPSQHLPYMVFAYVGMTAWIAFSGLVTRVSASLVTNAPLISKVFFPRLLLPIAVIGSVLVDLVVSLLVLAVLMVVYRIAPTPAIVATPAILLALIAMAMGIGTLLAPLTVRYRDVQYMVPVALQLALFASPIAYAVDKAPDKARLFFALNPLTPLLEALRWALLGTPAPGGLQLGYGITCSLAVLLIGIVVFVRFEAEAADVI